MSLRESAMMLLMATLCINAFSTMLYAAGIDPEGVTEADLTDFDDEMDLNTTLSGWTWDVAYSDIGFGVLTFTGIVWDLILGVPNIASKLGVPGFVTNALYGIWMFDWFAIGLLYWVGGREV